MPLSIMPTITMTCLDTAVQSLIHIDIKPKGPDHFRNEHLMTW